MTDPDSTIEIGGGDEHVEDTTTSPSNKREQETAAAAAAAEATTERDANDPVAPADNEGDNADTPMNAGGEDAGAVDNNDDNAEDEEEGGEEGAPRRGHTARSPSANSSIAMKRSERPRAFTAPQDDFDPSKFRARAAPSACVGIFGFKEVAPEEVEKRLREYGELERFDVIKHIASGMPKGFGFAYYASIEDAKRLVNDHDGKGLLIGTTRTRLDYSRTNGEAPRRSRQGGYHRGGGGGGYGGGYDGGRGGRYMDDRSGGDRGRNSDRGNYGGERGYGGGNAPQSGSYGGGYKGENSYRGGGYGESRERERERYDGRPSYESDRYSDRDQRAPSQREPSYSRDPIQHQQNNYSGGYESRERAPRDNYSGGYEGERGAGAGAGYRRGGSGVQAASEGGGYYSSSAPQARRSPDRAPRTSDYGRAPGIGGAVGASNSGRGGSSDRDYSRSRGGGSGTTYDRDYGQPTMSSSGGGQGGSRASSSYRAY